MLVHTHSFSSELQRTLCSSALKMRIETNKNQKKLQQNNTHKIELIFESSYPIGSSYHSKLQHKCRCSCQEMVCSHRFHCWHKVQTGTQLIQDSCPVHNSCHSKQQDRCRCRCQVGHQHKCHCWDKVQTDRHLRSLCQRPLKIIHYPVTEMCSLKAENSTVFLNTRIGLPAKVRPTCTLIGAGCRLTPSW